MATTENTVHVLHGSRYVGAFANATVTAHEDGVHSLVRSADGSQVYAAAGDMFATEAEAREVAKARRKPRTQRQPQALYGDFAQLAAFHGLRTDGSGRKAR
jgi:hypothetical protein